MLSKITGFAIYPKSQNRIQPTIAHDPFRANLTLKKIETKENTLFLWGSGDLNAACINGTYTLSFPKSLSLKQRNLLIRITEESIQISSDWLGSIPVFYNTATGHVSTHMGAVTKYSGFDLEGVTNFCEFGYSVFGTTPCPDIKIMRYLSELTLTGNTVIERHQDDFVLDPDVWKTSKSTDEIIRNIREALFPCSESEKVLLPLSGGYDSRLLATQIQDKSKLLAFSYGTAPIQANSREVVVAKSVSQKLNIPWQHVLLGDFNREIPIWTQLYGCSTHLHGMYQIEFYRHIQAQLDKTKHIVVSGIAGDIWAGKMSQPISRPDDIEKIGLHHGLHAPKKQLHCQVLSQRALNFFNQYHGILSSQSVYLVFVVRFKILLLSYLAQVPEHFGWPVLTPFLNWEIARDLCTLPHALREKRQWQQDFFKTLDLDFESQRVPCDTTNTLDIQALKKTPLDPIDIPLMGQLFHSDYLTEINTVIAKPRLLDTLLIASGRYPKVGYIGNILNKKLNKTTPGINAYHTIKALEIYAKS